MPTYEYKCEKCDHLFEEWRSMDDTTKVKCEKCKGKAEKLISGGTAIHFKGSGFYETDYKNK